MENLKIVEEYTLPIDGKLAEGDHIYVISNRDVENIEKVAKYYHKVSHKSAAKYTTINGKDGKSKYKVPILRRIY